MSLDLSLLRHLPDLQAEAQRILDTVAARPDFRPFRGKRLHSSSNLITSVPVGLRYRLLFDAKTAAPLGIFTHEDYNKIVKTGRIKRLLRQLH